MREYIYYFYPSYNISYTETYEEKDQLIDNNMDIHTINSNTISLYNNSLNNTDTKINLDNEFIFLINFFFYILLIFCGIILYTTIIKCFKKQPTNNNTNTLTSNIILLDKEENETCSICLILFQNDDEITRLNCGHLFHTHCVNQWISNKNNCPLCRINI